ncbi:hypothetical protein B0H14DRAFT_3855766, partial [Mycena olivaceomarginata]
MVFRLHGSAAQALLNLCHQLSLSLPLRRWRIFSPIGSSPLPRVLSADSLASPLYIVPVVDDSHRLAPDTCTCRCCFVPSEPRSRDVPPSLSSNPGTTV